MANSINVDPFRIMFRAAAVLSVAVGVYLWNWHSFTSTGSAFALYADVPRPCIALPLIVGGCVQFVGCRAYSRRLALIGAVMCLAVFLAAEISCIQTMPGSSGIGTYGWICGVYATFIFLTPRVPLPCLRDTR